MTPNDLLTKKDLEEFKRELFELLEPLTKGQAISQQKWLKSMDVRKILGISHNKLQQLRDDGTLTYHKLGGIIYYKPDELQKAMERAEKKSPTRSSTQNRKNKPSA